MIDCGLIIIFRVFYFLYQNTKLSRNEQLSLIVRSNKKPVYRLLEFFYKTTMYPLIFFSFVTFHNWSALILVNKHGFHHFSHILALGLFISYLVVTLFQIFWESTSKLNKIENANEFICAVFGAMIVTVSTHSKAYISLIVVFIFRGAVYIVSRRHYLRDFLNIEYTKIASVCMEIITILVLTSNSAAAALVLCLMTIGLQFVH